MSARYRFLFLESDSQFSPRAFAMLTSRKAFENQVRRLQQELTFIEDDSTRLQLNGPSASKALWGDECDLDELADIPMNWGKQRATLTRATEDALSCGADEQSFLEHRSAWLDQLLAFTSFASEINRRVGLRALEALKAHY